MIRWQKFRTSKQKKKHILQPTALKKWCQLTFCQISCVHGFKPTKGEKKKKKKEKKKRKKKAKEGKSSKKRRLLDYDGEKFYLWGDRVC
jgi:hypothetical protein